MRNIVFTISLLCWSWSFLVTTGARNPDPAFSNVDGTPGLTIWRVKDFGLVLLPEDEYGRFHSGDAYLVLKTAEGPTYSIHFWLGKTVSQDEVGTVAMKAVELDGLLGGAPTQYREIQGHESRKFLSYFSNIAYLEGGYQSGFQKTADISRKRLIRCKGTTRPVCHVVAWEERAKLIDPNDAFILDNGNKIWVWNGANSNRMERRKAMEVARSIQDIERRGRARLIIADNRIGSDRTVDRAAGLGQTSEHKFFTDLGVYPVIKARYSGFDEQFEQDYLARSSLNEVDFSVDPPVLNEMSRGDSIRKADLQPEHCYLLVAGGTSLFVYCGVGTTGEQQLKAQKSAVDYLRMERFGEDVAVVKVRPGEEGALFRALFQDWTAGPVAMTRTREGSAGRPWRSLVTGNRRIEENMFEDGTGKVDVWRVVGWRIVPVPADMHGIFFQGDSYVILYTYQRNNRENYVIYAWLGSKSTPEKRQTAQAMMMKMDDSLGGAPVQMVIHESRETKHFRLVFKWRMIVFQGSSADNFISRAQMNEHLQKSIYMFHVKGTADYNTKAVQLPPRAENLNSNDAFVLLVGASTTFVWNGKGASEKEKSFAMHVVKQLGRAQGMKVVTEFNEPSEFWKHLGRSDAYCRGGSAESAAYSPRLFQCSGDTGYVECDIVDQFSPEDLTSDGVYLLETFDTMYLWAGKASTDFERTNAENIASEYLSGLSSQGHKKQLQSVDQGDEPCGFTTAFIGWVRQD